MESGLEGVLQLVLPCSCLPPVVLEQIRPFFTSEGLAARLLQALYSLSPLPAHIQPFKDSGPCGSPVYMVGGEMKYDGERD